MVNSMLVLHLGVSPCLAHSSIASASSRTLWLADEYVMKSEPLEGLVRVIELITRAATTGEAHKVATGSGKSLTRRQTAA